jgi:putrescine aminotransferase
MGSKRSRTAEWQELDHRHFLHPFTNYKELGARGSRVITRADGIYIWDSDGRQILDAMSGLWCVNIGYGRSELVDAACEQMRSLPYYNSFFQCAHPPAIELAALLSEVSPLQFNHAFLTGSGSEANDTVIRMVRRFWDLQGMPDRRIIISRRNAYHGSTIAAASLGGMTPMHQQAGLPMPGIVHIEQPYWYELGTDLFPDEFGLKVAAELEAKILEMGVEQVAAFIGEPIQGAGGVIIPPDSYWPEIQRICDEYGILLIADEVITGFGRTGEWFGTVYYGLEPDLMPFAKGVTSGYLPLGGVLVSDRVAEVLVAAGEEFTHGFTYSGHPVACAVAIETIRLLRDEGIIDRVRAETGPYLEAAWLGLADHPLVGEARCVGLMAGLELVADKENRKRFGKHRRAGEHCRDICIEQGLVMRAVGDTMVVAPPLIITPAQIDELIARARHCLDLTAEQLGIRPHG